MMKPRFVASALAITITAAAALGACGGSAAKTDARALGANAVRATPLPARTVHFTARDYAFVGPRVVSGGTVRLAVTNEGRVGHQLALFRLKPGVTAAAAFGALAAAGNLEAGRPYGAWVAGPNMVAPGATHETITKLDPGEYVVACIIPGADGQPHAAKGMLTNLTVTAPAPNDTVGNETDVTARLPRATLNDFFFTLPDRFGRGTFAVENAGTQVHEFGIVHLHEGATLADVVAYERSPLPHTVPQPYDDAAGTTFLDPGTRVRLDLDLPRGRYAVLCFIPTPNGQPHYAIGMAKMFTVA
jgi:uncharacterized cupredoxin-like copper-binding protein